MTTTATAERVEERREFRQDLLVAGRLTVPVAMGYLPLGTAFGILLVSRGIPWFWAPTTALVVFAGSLEFLAVTMISTGLGIAEVAMTTLLVNFRHVFYGLSFPMRLLTGRAQRFYGVFALTDETYSLLTSAPAGSPPLTGRQISLVQLVSHGYWVTGSLLGALAGTALPRGTGGIEFALTALFTVLAWDHAKKPANRRSVAYGVLACLAGALAGGGGFLTVAVVVFLAALAADYYLFVVRGKRD